MMYTTCELNVRVISAANESHSERGFLGARRAQLRSVGARAKNLLPIDRNLDELFALVVIVSMTAVAAVAVRTACSVKRGRTRTARDEK